MYLRQRVMIAELAETYCIREVAGTSRFMHACMNLSLLVGEWNTHYLWS